MPNNTEVEVKQVRLVKGTGSQIDEAKASGEILDTDLVVQTDAPELQEKIYDLESIRTNSNLGAVASSELPSVRQTADEANALAKNAQQGVSFANYQAMVNNVNAYAYDKFIIGQSIYIGTREVPDLWVYAKYEASQPYTYTTDDAIVEALKTGSLRVGRYELAALETGKVNITNVVTTDTAQTITGTKTFESRIYYGSDKPERELPEGYTQLQWVNVAGGSTGANRVYLDTGIKIDHTIEFDVFYEYNNVGVGVASGQGVVMGARVSSSSWVCTVSGYNSFPTGYFGFNNNLRSQAYLMVGNNHVSFRTPADNPNVGVYTCVNENGTNTYQINRVSGYPATAPTLTLGCLHDGSSFSENLNGKIYYAKIWKNGELVRDYIPCISDLSGEVGFYDFVSNTFNKSSTNIPFGAGDGYIDQFALLSEVRGAVGQKQDRLTAGTNISITNNVISATIPSTYVTTNTAQTISGNKNFTGTLQKSGVAVATTTDVSTAVNNHNQDAESHSDIRADIDELDERIDEIQLFKFPNAIIRGEPTIQNGQISDFSVVSYLQFPFLIDFQDNAFQIDFCFTTATNVQTQQNIIDSNFGIALAIANGKGLMAISSNGTSWNIGSSVGTINIQPNTTYYARLSWNKLQYKTFLSTDGQTYTQDMVLVGATRPYPRTAFIGGCNQEETGHTPHPFLGTINMNKAFLYVNNQLIWQGMDDAGLATRADISLSNLDAHGEARFTDKQDVINDLEAIRSGATAGSTALQSISSSDVTTALGYTPANNTDLTTHTGNGTIHVTASDKVAWSNKLNNPTGGTVGQVITKTETGEEWADAKGGYFPSLLEHKWSDHIINDVSWVRADTFSWLDGTVYSNAYNHLVADFSSGTKVLDDTGVWYYSTPDGHKIVDASDTTQVTNVENLYNTTGVAWYYILDRTYHRFKLPRTKYGFTGLRDAVGKYVAESLPNITGAFVFADNIVKNDASAQYTTNITGCFSASPYTQNTCSVTNVSINNVSSNNRRVNFNANNSSSAYQNNAPVQQRATQMYLYFYVGEYSQTAIEQTAGLDTELFNEKVDLDAHNLNDDGKSMIAKLGMPSGRYRELSLGASGATYTAPANGYFAIAKLSTGANQMVYLGAPTIACQSWSSATNQYLQEFVPAKAGQVVSVTYSLGGTTAFFRFVYAEGDNT